MCATQSPKEDKHHGRHARRTGSPCPRPLTPPADLDTVRSILQVQQEQQHARGRSPEGPGRPRPDVQPICSTRPGRLQAARARCRPTSARSSPAASFEPAELQAALDSARQLVSDLTACAVVQGPGRFHGMFNDADQLQAAVDDLLGAPRDEAVKTVKVARLQGIRELYLMLTGDYDLHGGYHPDRVQLATTADFTGLVKNALNKVVVNQWERLGRAGYDWWQDIVTVEHFTSLNDITGTLVGTVGTLPTVAEGGEYTELAIGDSPETASFAKYGGYIPLTLELIDRDDARKLSAYARELANAGLRKISALVAAIFTDNSGVGPTLADTGALFNATAVTTAGGHANLLTTALGGQPVGNRLGRHVQPAACSSRTPPATTAPARKMAINPRFCLVPRALQPPPATSSLNDWDVAGNIHADNLQKARSSPSPCPSGPTPPIGPPSATPPSRPPSWSASASASCPKIFVAGDETQPRRLHERREPHQGPHLLRRLGQRLPPAAQVERRVGGAACRAHACRAVPTSRGRHAVPSLVARPHRGRKVKVHHGLRSRHRHEPVHPAHLSSTTSPAPSPTSPATSPAPSASTAPPPTRPASSPSPSCSRRTPSPSRAPS